jgi:hypothetical protein
MSPAEYLAWERAQPGKHEYHLGDTITLANGAVVAIDELYEGAFELEAG